VGVVGGGVGVCGVGCGGGAGVGVWRVGCGGCGVRVACGVWCVRVVFVHARREMQVVLWVLVGFRLDREFTFTGIASGSFVPHGSIPSHITD
jgi:hypothetical protein